MIKSVLSVEFEGLCFIHLMTLISCYQEEYGRQFLINVTYIGVNGATFMRIEMAKFSKAPTKFGICSGPK